MLAGLLPAVAAEVTFATTNKTVTTFDGFKIDDNLSGSVLLSTDKPATLAAYDNRINVLTGNKLRIKGVDGVTITKIVFTFLKSDQIFKSDDVVSSGAYSISGTTGTWEGSANTVTITRGSGKAAQIASLTITYTTAGQVDPPVTEPQEFKPNFVDPLEMTVGDTKDVTPAGTDIPEIIYISNYDAIATVSEAGVVTAVAEGTTTITAAWEATDKWLANEDGVTFTVNVKAPVREDFVPGFKNLEMAVGDTKDVTPAGDNIPEIVYVSDNNAIATVSDAGVVTAVAEGTATITAMWDATNKWNANLDGVTFTVTVTPPSNWVLVTDAALLRAGDQVILAARDKGYAVSTEANTNNRKSIAVTFNDDKTAINKIDGVMVFELGKETAGWTFKTTNYAGTTQGYLGNNTTTNNAKISSSLEEGYYASISFNNDNKATIKFANTTRGNFQYNGVGSSSLFNCYENDKDDSGYELVSIYRKDVPREPQDFVYTFEDVTMTEGDTKNVMPEGSRPDTFVFGSDNEAIAEIDDDGVITAKAAGEATISVMWSDEAGNWNDGEAEFKVVVTPALQNVTLAWDVESKQINLGEEFTPVLTVTPQEAASKVTYTSDNTSVADIDAEGELTVAGAGTAVIKAVIAGDDTYADAEASFTLTVIDPDGPQVITATFDFTPAGAYGLTTFSTNDYEKVVTSAAEQEVTVNFTDKYRQWKGESDPDCDFRIYTNATMKFSVPEGCAIKSVVFYRGNSSGFGVTASDNGAITEQKEGSTVISRTWTASVSDMREVVFTATKTSTMKAVDVVYELSEKDLYLPATLPVFEGYENGVKVGDVVKITPSHRTHKVSWRVVPGEEMPAEVAYMRAAATDWTLHDVEGVSVEHTIESLDEPYILLAKSVDRRGVESDVHGLKISTDGNAMTGIENVAADTTSEAVYYNLQGVRVNGTPAAGVYVRLQGGKASKVVVK